MFRSFNLKTESVFSFILFFACFVSSQTSVKLVSINVDFLFYFLILMNADDFLLRFNGMC